MSDYEFTLGRLELDDCKKDLPASDAVRLKNGCVVAAALLDQVERTILQLDHSGTRCALYDLVMLCRFSSHKPFGAAAKRLVECGLIEGATGSYHVTPGVRTIVLAMSSGDGLDVTFRPAAA